jgi:uncharacterized protein (DUF983 family)
VNAFAPCPKCNNALAERVKFTWWGGVLGPKLLSHVKCGACGSKYNGKTGKDNTTGIAIYFVVVAILGFGAVFVLIAGLALVSMVR